MSSVLNKFWKEGITIAGTKTNRYWEVEGRCTVIKKIFDDDDYTGHLKKYDEICSRGILTPQLIMSSPQDLLLQYSAHGIRDGSSEKWTETLVNFTYDSSKRTEIIDFLTRSLQYAIDNNWKDFHTGNIIHENGSLRLIDYVPNRGKHEIGDLGLQKIKEHEKESLVNNNFDTLYEKAVSAVSGKVSLVGLNALKKIRGQQT